MRHRTVIAVALASLAFVAVGCGSDSDSDGDATVQEKLSAAVIDQFKEVGGMKIDEACISDAAAALSDADAQSLLDNLDADPSTLSAGQQAFVDASGACVSVG
jgi:hypothetical protein